MITTNRFGIYPASELAKQPDLVPDAPGVYLAHFPDGIQLLRQWRYFEFDTRMPSQVSGDPVLYIGMADRVGLRDRIRNHIQGNSRMSTLRMTTGALLRTALDLTPVVTAGKSYFHFGRDEARLTDWLSKNVRFGFFCCDRPAEMEQALIHSSCSPLNITERKTHPYSRHLMSMRRAFSGRPLAQIEQSPSSTAGKSA